MESSPFQMVLRRGVFGLLTLVLAGLMGGMVFLVLMLLGGGLGLIVGVAAIPFWLTGAVVVGGPSWILLRALGRHDRRTARIGGALTASPAATLVFWTIFAGARPPTPGEAPGLTLLALAAAVAGAVAGEAVWKLARDDAHVFR